MQKPLDFDPSVDSGRKLTGVSYTNQLLGMFRSVVTRRKGSSRPNDLQKDEIWSKVLDDGQTVDLIGDGTTYNDGTVYTYMRATTITLADNATTIDVGYYNMVALNATDSDSTIRLSNIVHKLPANEILKLRNGGVGTIILTPSSSLVINDTHVLSADSFIELLFDGTHFVLYNVSARQATQAEVASGVTVGDTPAFIRPEDVYSRVPYNYIPNPASQLWTKGGSFNTNTNNAGDTWINSFVGGTQTVTKMTYAVGDGIGSPYFTRIVTVGGTGASNRSYYSVHLEDVRRFSNKKMVIPILAKADGNKKVGVRLVQSFGTGGSPSTNVTVGEQYLNLTTAEQQFNLVFDLPSIAGKILGSNNNSYLALDVIVSDQADTNIGVQNITLDLAFVGLYNGEVAPPIVCPDITETQRRCERLVPYWSIDNRVQNFAGAVGTYSVAQNGWWQYNFQQTTQMQGNFYRTRLNGIDIDLGVSSTAVTGYGSFVQYFIIQVYKGDIITIEKVGNPTGTIYTNKVYYCKGVTNENVL